VPKVHTINLSIPPGGAAARLLPGLVLVLSLAAGCTGMHSARDTTPKADPAALTVVAEIALERGDCKEAAESYAKAAQVGAVSLARRASLVALGCEHLPAAWESVSRWRALAPNDREANAMYAAVALKLYRISDARSAINDFSHSPPKVARGKPGDGLGQGDGEAAGDDTGVAGGADGTNGVGRDGGNSGGARADESNRVPKAPPPVMRGTGKGSKPVQPNADLTALTALLLEQSDAPTVLLAMSSTLESTSNAPESLSLLGELSLDAFDAQRAERYAQQALERNPRDFAARRVLARSYVVRGDPTKAIATAREAMRDDPAHSIFDLAEVLTQLDRVEDAHQELERLRAAKAPTGEIDGRLALLAFEAGDMKEAQQRFSELASNGTEANDTAMLYLADIASRDGDTNAAIAGYRRLYDSSVALQARSRAAALLLTRSDRTEALTLLDDYVTEHPESEFDLTLAKAHLLADHGEAEAGLALLSTALDRHPGHPSIEYDRAVILEQAGRVHESVTALEHLLTVRVDDPTLLNALGYTLADHNLELSHAETLIRRALVVMPDSPAALDSLGWVRFRQGDSKAAVVALERAYYISHDSEIAAHWGEALWVSGEHQQARKVWAAALAREPASQHLKATLARFLSDAK
jgi:tetratricopeptide (TPR) repeat protein